jgi:flagellar biogenesis protein FliO
MHWLAATTGLWMLFPAALFAQNVSGRTFAQVGEGETKSFAPATANCALDLASVMAARESKMAGDTVKTAGDSVETANEPPRPVVESPVSGSPSTPAIVPIVPEQPVEGSGESTSNAGAKVSLSGTIDAPSDESRVAPTSGDSVEPAAAGGIPKGKRGGLSGSRDVPWYRGPFVALAAVLALIAGAWKVFKRYVPAARPVAPEALRVIGRTPISAKQSAVLLHVGKRVILVGVTPDSMRTLAEFTEDEEVAMLMGKAASATSPAQHEFRDALAQEFEKYEDEAVDEEPVSPVAVDHAMRDTQGQLQGLLNKLRAMQTA